jgi:acyl carrier protein
MTDQGIYAELTEIFRGIFRDPSLTLTDQMGQSQIAGWNSFAQVNIILAIENRFGFEVRTSELQHLRTIGDFVQLIARRTSESSSLAPM